MTTADLTSIQRPSGGYAMLAVDQREAMRVMLSEAAGRTVSDQEVQAFKLEATRILSPFASGVLLDKQFVLDEALAQGAVAPGAGLIAAADAFESAYDELVGRVTIDEAVDPVAYAAQGVKALKLLVIYRPDQPADERIALVEDFVVRCASAGLVSIIEPVSRKPAAGGDFDWNEGIHAAARELGSLGADLYKAEVPFHGQAEEREVRDACARLTAAIDSPWVVLSSGVPEHVFPDAVRSAMLEGASGFLSGRAVWLSSISAPDQAESLRTAAADRLRRLADLVDETIALTGAAR